MFIKSILGLCLLLLLIPKARADDIAQTAQRIVGKASSDSVKAYRIYAWMVRHVMYDKALDERPVSANEHRQLQEPQLVLNRREGVCQGIAGLYVALSEAVGIEARVIIGHVRPASRSSNAAPLEKARVNHAWNAVYFNNAWHLLDATWATSSAVGLSKFWNVAPADMIMTHLPQDPAWQLLPQIVGPQHFWPEEGQEQLMWDSNGMGPTEEGEMASLLRAVSYNPENIWARLDLAAVLTQQAILMLDSATAKNMTSVHRLTRQSAWRLYATQLLLTGALDAVPECYKEDWQEAGLVARHNLVLFSEAYGPVSSLLPMTVSQVVGSLP